MPFTFAAAVLNNRRLYGPPDAVAIGFPVNAARFSQATESCIWVHAMKPHFH
jgi:hypothetical protein